MAALWSLTRKELGQVRKLFAILVIFSIFTCWLALRMLEATGGVISYLSISSLYAFPVLALVAYIIGYHLVSREYYGRTQRFLEALPIRRMQMAAVKYTVGLCLLLALVLVVWAFSLNEARDTEPVSQRFVALMGLRLAVFVFALWSVVFAYSLLGRLRIPVFAASVFIIILMDEYTTFEFFEFGPLSLVDNDLFTSERNRLPLRQLLEGLGVGIGFTALGFFLVGRHDGSLTESLAVPMSSREKSFLMVILIVAVGIYSFFGPEADESPFMFSNRFVASDGRVRIAYVAPAFENRAQSLLAELAPRVESLDDLVAFPDTAFTVQVSLANALSPREYGMESSSMDQGIMTSANFLDDPLWSFDFFSAFIIHQVIGVRTGYRTTLEPAHWILDGFSLWWTDHYRDDLAIAGPDPHLTAAVYANRELPLDATTIRQWDRTADRLGDGLAMALAYSGWWQVREQAGDAAVRALAAAEFSRPVHGDIRDWWAEWRRPFPERFETVTGLSWERFLEDWAKALESLAQDPAYRDRLGEIPRGALSVDAVLDENGLRHLAYRLQLDTPPPAGSRCLALHSPLPPYDIQVPRAALREAEINIDGNNLDFDLYNQYGRNSRAYAALECDFPGLDLPVRYGVARVIMP